MPYAKNGDVDIYFEIHGDHGPGLVFAHGAGGNAVSWWQQVPDFRDRYRCVVFDHRGFGRSQCAPEAQSAHHFEGDLVAVLDAAGIDSATVVCQSMGGWTGARAAVFNTDRINGVFLANTPGAVMNATVRDNMTQLQSRVAESGLINIAISEVFSKRSPEGALLYNQISAFNTQARPNIMDESVYVSPEQVKATGVRFMVLSSDLDTLFPPQVLESVAGDIGATLVRVEGAGHSTYFEKPREFNAILADFLASE